jgi:hypothetical protein
MLAALTVFLAPYRNGSAATQTSTAEVVGARSMTGFDVHMPSLGGAESLDAEPLGAAGHVVLLRVEAPR